MFGPGGRLPRARVAASHDIRVPQPAPDGAGCVRHRRRNRPAGRRTASRQAKTAVSGRPESVRSSCLVEPSGPSRSNHHRPETGDLLCHRAPDLRRRRGAQESLTTNGTVWVPAGSDIQTRLPAPWTTKSCSGEVGRLPRGARRFRIVYCGNVVDVVVADLGPGRWCGERHRRRQVGPHGGDGPGRGRELCRASSWGPAPRPGGAMQRWSRRGCRARSLRRRLDPGRRMTARRRRIALVLDVLLRAEDAERDPPVTWARRSSSPTGLGSCGLRTRRTARRGRMPRWITARSCFGSIVRARSWISPAERDCRPFASPSID